MSKLVRFDPIGTAGRLRRVIDRSRTTVSPDINANLDINENDATRNQPRNYQQLFGLYKPFKLGIIVGPGYPWLILLTISMIFLLTLMIIQHNQILLIMGLQAIVFGYTLYGGSFFFFLYVSLRDPGIIPKDYNLRDLMSDTQEFRESNPTARYYHYCRRCEGYRPVRSFHCPICRICIRHHDMHLVPGGSCIGIRQRKSIVILNIFLVFLGTYLILIACSIFKHNQFSIKKNLKSVLLAAATFISALAILAAPQTGVVMLLYRMFLISVDRTCREDYWRFRLNNHNELLKYSTIWKNWLNFFKFHKLASKSSVAVRSNQVTPLQTTQTEDYSTRWPNYSLHSIISKSIPRILTRKRMESYAEPTEELSIISARARLKSNHSEPLIQHGELQSLPDARLKISKHKKPSALIQQKIKHFQKYTELPKADISHRKNTRIFMTKSEGCIPTECEPTENVVQLARAEQIQKIIQLVMHRDRNSLAQMARRINIAGLVGLNPENFDPDNLQLLELDNGIPMLVPRYREPGGFRSFRGRNLGVFGIPQMVAAGLIPVHRQRNAQMRPSLLTHSNPITHSNSGMNSITIPSIFQREHVTASSRCPVLSLDWETTIRRARRTLLESLTSSPTLPNIAMIRSLAEPEDNSRRLGAYSAIFPRPNILARSRGSSLPRSLAEARNILPFSNSISSEEDESSSSNNNNNNNSTPASLEADQASSSVSLESNNNTLRFPASLFVVINDGSLNDQLNPDV